MLDCFVNPTTEALRISVLTVNEYPLWLTQQSPRVITWLESTQFRQQAGNFSLIPAESGQIEQVVCLVSDKKNFWNVGALAQSLPEDIYQFDLAPAEYPSFAIAWGLGAYQFSLYKSSNKKIAKLVIPAECSAAAINNTVESIYLVRDLINIPTDHMGPTELAYSAEALAKQFHASFQQVVGEDLLKFNFPAIHLVGRACDDEPRLLDMRWGNAEHPKITLVGKGVCFDTGGLNIKPTSAMTLMKKDMGGAANVLGLARMIMQAKLPVNLRVLIPAVENSISGNAFRPGDVVKSRSGITIEIGNTDAEGRVVLADALTEAVSEKPDLIIDLATLTGAARVALGADLPALFSNNDVVAADVLQHAELQNDPMWRLPLFAPYRDAIMSPIADINNSTTDSLAGAITAALFLKEFVPNEIPWIHLDMMAWNVKSRPGRPQGGEAMALRALFSYLSTKYLA